jgi:hypothetical protein
VQSQGTQNKSLPLRATMNFTPGVPNSTVVQCKLYSNNPTQKKKFKLNKEKQRSNSKEKKLIKTIPKKNHQFPTIGSVKFKYKYILD